MNQNCKEFLMSQFGDESVVEELYAEFVESFPKTVEEAASLAAARDWEKLDRAAHALKGNALVMGHAEAADAAIELRRAAKLADAEKTDEYVALLRKCAAEL